MVNLNPLFQRSGKPLQDYDAHCLCGAVRIKFKLGPLEDETVISCNCSVCTRNGYILIYPMAEDVTIVKGDSDLSSYVFATKEKPHRFCKHCGSSMLIDFTGCKNEKVNCLMAINARMVPGIEDRLDSLPLKRVDGKAMTEPAYDVPPQ